jgi:hypothetical protein
MRRPAAELQAERLERGRTRATIRTLQRVATATWHSLTLDV